MSTGEGSGESGGKEEDLGTGMRLWGSASTSRACRLASSLERASQPHAADLSKFYLSSPKAKRFWLKNTRWRRGELPSVLAASSLPKESTSLLTWTLVGCRR